MKHIGYVQAILFSAVVLAMSVNGASAQPYSVSIRVDQATQSPNGQEWQIYYIYADVFDQNGVYVPPSSAYYYHWYWNQCNGQGYQTWDEYWGLAQLDPDGSWVNPGPCCPTCTYQTFFAYVTVRINGVTYASADVRLPVRVRRD